MSAPVQDVLRYAVVGGELAMRNLDVTDLVHSVLEDVPTLASVSVHIGDLPPVRADALQLRLLLQNLLTNVAKPALVCGVCRLVKAGE